MTGVDDPYLEETARLRGNRQQEWLDEEFGERIEGYLGTVHWYDDPGTVSLVLIFAVVLGGLVGLLVGVIVR